MCDLPDRDLDTNIFRRFRLRPHLRARRSGIDAVFATRYLDATMTRFNLVLALIAVLALAFADPARAMGDHDHASPAADSATDSPWACTAVCTADANTNVRSSPASLDPRDLPRIPVCLNRSARVGSPAPTRGSDLPRPGCQSSQSRITLTRSIEPLFSTAARAASLRRRQVRREGAVQDLRADPDRHHGR